MQPQAAPQPPHQQPASKKGMSSKKKIFLSIGGILVLLIIIVIATSSNKNNTSTNTNTTSSSSNTAQAQPTNQPTPGINQPARDGKFEFTVTAFKCGITQIEQSDNSYDVSKPQGQFCTMNVNVKNIGNVSQSFDANSQYIYDAASKQYDYSSDGTIAANPTSSQFMLYPTVNPGVSISGTIAFDIPNGTTPTYAMLHDSSASNGVRVNLQ